MKKEKFIELVRRAFNEMMNTDTTTFDMVQEELFRIENKMEPKILVLNYFILSVASK